VTSPPTYSYQGQDEFVVAHLKGLRGGFFVDSGASDGVSGSNTKLLEDHYGWNGICVEPNAELYARLVAHRRCHTVNCCLFERDGPVEFLESARVLGGIMETYDPAHLAYARRATAASWPADADVGPVMKPARTLRSVLDELGAPKVIDYWSLDTEGSELAILESFPFDTYRFRVLTVEHNFTPARERLHAFLVSRGYRRIAVLGIDDAYVAADEIGGGDAVDWRSAAFRRARR
jgi:hypothetical protein